MNYTKPVVEALGQAVDVIEGGQRKSVVSQLDGGFIKPPAYDLDEE